MSAPGNRRHRNHALALRHLFVSTVWKLQLVSSRVAKSGELTSSNSSLHHPGDPYSGIRSTWGLCRSEEKMDSWPNGPGLWIKPLLWKATGITEVCCESPWLKQSMGISICLKTRSPLELALAIVVPLHLAPLVLQDEWKQHLPSLYPALLPNQPLRSAPVGKLLSCLSCLSNWFTKF